MPLTNITIINSLSGAACNAYLDGYGVPRAAGASCRRLVKIAIGCRC
jgi:hypothetical protein